MKILTFATLLLLVFTKTVSAQSNGQNMCNFFYSNNQFLYKNCNDVGIGKFIDNPSSVLYPRKIFRDFKRNLIQRNNPSPQQRKK